MKTQTHTPGPWQHWTNDFGICSVGPNPRRPIAKLFSTEADSAHANSRLIAACPDMLEALGSAQAWLAGYMAQTPDLIDVRRKVEAAIAKATCQENPNQ